MREVKADKNLIAYCGLFCGACGAYLKEKCNGCRGNVKATWCQIRKCCLENNYSSCADCQTYSNVNDCKKFNNIFSKIFALIFRSNRKACIDSIRKVGPAAFALEMAKNKQQSLKS